MANCTERVGADQYCVRSLLHRLFERRGDLAVGLGGDDVERLPHCRSSRLNVRDRQSNLRVAGIDQHHKARVPLQQLMQKPKLLGCKARIHGGDASDIAAGPIEANDEAGLDRVNSDHENDRNRCGRGLGRECRRHAARRHNDVRRPPDQVGRQLRQPGALPVPPAIFDQNIAALDIAGFSEPFAEAGDESRVCFGRARMEQPNHRHRRLLRARRERPSRCRAAERDELAALHSITSSANGAKRRSAEWAVVDGRAKSSPYTPRGIHHDAGAPARRNEQSLRKLRERGSRK